MAIGGEVHKKIEETPQRFSVSTCVIAALLVLILILIGIVVLLGLSSNLQSEVAKDKCDSNPFLDEFTKDKRQNPLDMEASKEDGHCALSNSPEAWSLLKNLTRISMDIKLMLEEHFANINYDQCNTKDSTFSSCVDILQQFPTCPSGYYLIKSNTAYPIRVYCDMTKNCGGIIGGWRRIAYLNIHEPGVQCPAGFTQRGNPPSCVRPELAGGCTAVKYTTDAMPYTHICGRINAIHYNTPDGFTKQSDIRPNNPTIDDNYVDGVSLTSNGNGGKRTHIWTFAASSCSLSKTNVPSFVGDHYSFDGGIPGTGPVYEGILWDEHQCPSTPSSNESWFHRKLPHNTPNSVEMRVCRDQDYADEDLLLQIVEINVQ